MAEITSSHIEAKRKTDLARALVQCSQRNLWTPDPIQMFTYSTYLPFVNEVNS